MIGLVNATGVSDALHREVSRKTNELADKPAGQPPPILSNEQAANRVLETAVESIRLQTEDGQRGLPGGEQSDRFSQADLETAASGTPLGAALDVTA